MHWTVPLKWGLSSDSHTDTGPWNSSRGNSLYMLKNKKVWLPGEYDWITLCAADSDTRLVSCTWTNRVNKIQSCLTFVSRHPWFISQPLYITFLLNIQYSPRICNFLHFPVCVISCFPCWLVPQCSVLFGLGWVSGWCKSTKYHYVEINQSVICFHICQSKSFNSDKIPFSFSVLKLNIATEEGNRMTISESDRHHILRVLLAFDEAEK